MTAPRSAATRVAAPEGLVLLGAALRCDRLSHFS